MNATAQTLEYLELVNHYPSPHNGQPMRLKQIGDGKFELFFMRSRGLQSSDISYIFSFTSMGVFVEHMRLAARALGHDFAFTPSLPKAAAIHGDGLIRVGICKLGWNVGLPDDNLRSVLHSRRTSRKKYTRGVDAATTKLLTDAAAQAAMQLVPLDKTQARQAIWLNQRAVFDDMFDEPVRRELDRWLRYSQSEKLAKRDGLAYDCMEINGRLMKYIVHHPGFLRAPGIAWLLKRYYLRTMTDESSIFYMTAPFASEQQAFIVGTVIMQLWALVAQSGYYLHPFGTVMSNHAAHQDFLRLVSIIDESRAGKYLVFIFRAGVSQPPVASARLPVIEHLLMESA